MVSFAGQPGQASTRKVNCSGFKKKEMMGVDYMQLGQAAMEDSTML